MSEWVSEWVRHQISGLVDSHYSVLTGCCPVKINPHKRSLCHQEVFHQLWNKCGAVLLTDKTKSQRGLHKLLNNHIDVVILCGSRFWSTVHRGKRQIDIFHLKSQHIITVSIITVSTHQTVGNTAVLPLPASRCHDQSDRRLAATFHISIQHFFFKSSKTPHTTTWLFFGPVTWLCGLKCRIIVFHTEHPLLPTLRRI